MVGDEFFVLRLVVQFHVGVKQTIDEFAFLLLSMRDGQAQSQTQHKGTASHGLQAAKCSLVCKANCR